MYVAWRQYVYGNVIINRTTRRRRRRRGRGVMPMQLPFTGYTDNTEARSGKMRCGTCCYSLSGRSHLSRSCLSCSVEVWALSCLMRRDSSTFRQQHCLCLTRSHLFDGNIDSSCNERPCGGVAASLTSLLCLKRWYELRPVGADNTHRDAVFSQLRDSLMPHCMCL